MWERNLVSPRGDPFKVIIFSVDESAKAKFVGYLRLTSRGFSEKNSIGADFFISEMEIEGVRGTLQFWDLATDEAYRFTMPPFMREACGGIFVYDAAAPEPLQGLDRYLGPVRDELGQVPVAIVGMNNGGAGEERGEESAIAAKLQAYDKFDFFLETVATREDAEGVREALARRMFQLDIRGGN